MSKKIDERLPREIGEGALPSYAAIKSPWEKLVGFRDAMHYGSRYESILSAAVMQAFRILVPDYKERAQELCRDAFQRLYFIQSNYGRMGFEDHNVHPFCRGSFVGALTGDSGDEVLMMCGRCQDFGTYRAEKELDVCDWDVVGSELCRATTQSLQAGAEAWANCYLRPGTKLEYHMVEAKGCGDRHCRIVAESRDKYPMPPHEQWECFGPVATADQIKYTAEEDTVKESMVFREECDYKFTNGTNMEKNASESIMIPVSTAASLYILPTVDAMIRAGKLDENTVKHVLRCVCEAAGKSAFGEHYAKEGLRKFLNAPLEVDDGRLMGGHIEMVLQSVKVPYEVEAFNSEEVVYMIDRNALGMMAGELNVQAHIAFWYGMTRTLVNTQWFLWEEDSPEGKLRIRIARKIDKFC